MSHKIALLVLGLLLGFVAGITVQRTQNDKSDKTDQELQTAQSQVHQLQTQLTDAATKAENCLAKFQKQTYLYEGGIVRQTSVHWIIPAEVKPVLVNSFGEAFYTQVDPSTHVETQHLKPDSR